VRLNASGIEKARIVLRNDAKLFMFLYFLGDKP
jgi:hypothetical protein